MTKNYLEKVYAGLLGMNIGIRLGAPVEPTLWTYERIRDTYGEITNYVKEYKNFAADDDANGPFYFLRALYDKPADRDLTPQDVADAWLNYTREGVGMFWWGGYGVSTEHTTYLNLKHGVQAPRSGSIAQNGRLLAEQIGGQIFIDTWGLVNPGDPQKAARYGEIAASVSHDGEGLNGARFFCAAIAAAFEESDPARIIQMGLDILPAGSLYAGVAAAVIDFHRKHPADWRACHAMLVENWGYDKYGGVCHIIPNAGVCVMSLLYSGGSFARAVEIATMSGWDTDCNAGNVGTVMGVAGGLSDIPQKYRAPINDFLVLSGISGYLNILDLPSYAKEVALLGYRLAGKEAPASLQKSWRPGEVYFDFELPGSTHGLRLSDPFFCRARHSTERAAAGGGSLEILVDRISRGEQCKVFYKPFYTRADFSDERYSPVFSPTVYSGQVMRAKLYLDQWAGQQPLWAVPYIRASAAKRDILGAHVKLVPNEWVEMEYTVPDLEGDLADEAGFIIEGDSPAKAKTLGKVFLDEFSVSGKARYSIDITKQHLDFGAVTPFSFDHGSRDIQDGRLLHMRYGPAFAYGGNYYSKDYTICATVRPLAGESHLLLVRAKGALWGYAGGFAPNGTVALFQNNHGFSPLAEADFPWELERDYRILLRAQGDRLTLTVDGKELLDVQETSYHYGMYGFGSLAMGRTAFSHFEVEEL